MSHKDHDEFDEDWISKSEVKRQMDALQDLGRALTNLNAKQLATIPMTELLAEAVDEFKRLKHREAKRRMLQRIGKLMREEDVDQIKAAYELTQPGSAASLRIDKQLESWRARLIDLGDKAVGQFLTEYANTDRQQLRTLVRNAKKAADKQPDNMYANNDAKKLFKFLRDATKC